MRCDAADYPVVQPTRLADALALLADAPHPLTPLAGATDLFVPLAAGTLPPTTFLDLSRLPELAEPPRFDGDRLVFGARTTYAAVRRNREVVARLPLLGLAARELGALQIQNRGTWAGNVENASPAADGVPVLMAYDGEVELASAAGSRTLPLADYYTGYRQTRRRPEELIVRLSVRVPAAGAAQGFRKVGTRRMQAISKVVFAGLLERAADGTVERARLVLGSVAPVTLRLPAAERVLAGRPLDGAAIDAAVRAALGAIAPIDDVRSTRAYRLRVSERVIRRFLEDARG